jgi:hypothetical protein
VLQLLIPRSYSCYMVGEYVTTIRLLSLLKSIHYKFVVLKLILVFMVSSKMSVDSQIAILSQLNNKYVSLQSSMREADVYIEQVLGGAIVLSPEDREKVEQQINLLNNEIDNFIETINYLDEFIVDKSQNPYISNLVFFPQAEQFYIWLQDVYYEHPLETRHLTLSSKSRRHIVVKR